MRFGYREVCLQHETGSRHPENPDRLRAIREGLTRRHTVEYVEADPVPVEAIERVHAQEYVDQIRTFCATGGGSWDPDTVAVEATWEAARASAGLACWAAEAAIGGAQGGETPFSLGRPPGHHAVTDDAMGFCFFNNVAIATKRVLRLPDIDRVAIVDWDVHHGNGTQDIFAGHGDVFYASIHERGLYPGTGALGETGTDAGEGTVLNVPLPPGSGDAEFLAAMDDAIAPALSLFDPDILLISAGFDAHENDPISRAEVTTEGFGLLTARCQSIAATNDTPLAFILEGGYNLEALADSVGIVHDVFHGYTPIEPDTAAGGEARSIIRAALDALEAA